MPRKGPRPHVWKVQGELNHSQYLAWLQMKAQAQYRREVFAIGFEEFQRLWGDNWHRKGRGIEDYCLTREDPKGAWIWGNVQCMPRIEHLRRQRLFKKLENQEIKNGKQKQNLGS